MVTPPHISVCICTYQRPKLLRRLIDRLLTQVTNGSFTFDIVICDNDSAQSAERVVTEVARSSPIALTYCAESIKNIALARNRALANSRGGLIAFIDDDEFPADSWLIELYRTCTSYDAAGVLGPVRPHFDETPPRWIIRGRFCERPEYPTGRRMKWTESRTGNFIFRRAILEGDCQPFKEEFGTGGEDKDFFMRMTDQGQTFVWCNEAVVYETVPPSRWTRSYMLKRALLRGRNILKHPKGRAVFSCGPWWLFPSMSLSYPSLSCLDNTAL